MNRRTARVRRHVFAMALAAIAAGVLAISAPAFAAGATPTAQASYYGLDWVPYIDPTDLPPLSERPAVCIVDTGAAVTPDLPASDPNGHFIARWAVDGGSGAPFSSSDIDIHGTLMATYAFGADNGWGLTGIFPQGRVLEVRAQTLSDQGIYYGAGARACRDYAAANSLNLAAVSMSLGSPRTIDSSEQAAMASEVAAAHSLNYSLVAAAGNEGSSVGFPGSYSGIFTVAAGQVGSDLCTYASYGPEVEIVGPSCGATDVDPFSGATFISNRGGSSEATASVAATIALLRSLVPTATYSDAEGWIVAGASIVNGRPLLNGVGAMHTAGLDAILARAQARQKAAASTDPTDDNSSSTTTSLRTPRARVSFARGFVRVKALNRPAKAKLVVKLIYRKSEFARRSLKRSSSKSTLKIRSKKRPWRVEVRYIKGSSVSSTIRFRDRRTSTFVQLKSASNK